MSTRSLIGIKNKDGKIKCIYCHWDGYPTGGVGETLLNYYKDEAAINKLMDLGDLSSLGKKPISDKNYWTDYGSSEGDYCGTYKERGDKNTDAKIENDEDMFTARGISCFADYIYLFKEGKWFVKSAVDVEFTDLQDYIKGLVEEEEE